MHTRTSTHCANIVRMKWTPAISSQTVPTVKKWWNFVRRNVKCAWIFKRIGNPYNGQSARIAINWSTLKWAYSWMESSFGHARSNAWWKSNKRRQLKKVGYFNSAPISLKKMIFSWKIFAMFCFFVGVKFRRVWSMHATIWWCKQWNICPVGYGLILYVLQRCLCDIFYVTQPKIEGLFGLWYDNVLLSHDAAFSWSKAELVFTGLPSGWRPVGFEHKANRSNGRSIRWIFVEENRCLFFVNWIDF